MEEEKFVKSCNGTLYGFLPVDVDMTSGEMPIAQSKWWYPELIIDIVSVLWYIIGTCVVFLTGMEPENYYYALTISEEDAKKYDSDYVIQEDE